MLVQSDAGVHDPVLVGHEAMVMRELMCGLPVLPRCRVMIRCAAGANPASTDTCTQLLSHRLPSRRSRAIPVP